MFTYEVIADGSFAFQGKNLSKGEKFTYPVRLFVPWAKEIGGQVEGDMQIITTPMESTDTTTKAPVVKYEEPKPSVSSTLDLSKESESPAMPTPLNQEAKPVNTPQVAKDTKKQVAPPASRKLVPSTQDTNAISSLSLENKSSDELTKMYKDELSGANRTNVLDAIDKAHTAALEKEGKKE